jgi:hypothetical protein
MMFDSPIPSRTRAKFEDSAKVLHIMPPIPPKKTMDKTDKRLVEDRSQLLNLFIKQLVRCPYLYESEEFRLFIRPHIPLE